MTQQRRTRQGRGFTLIELMVTIMVASVLLTIAVPSFVTFQRNSELTSAANSLLAAMNSARGEAMKRNARTMVTPLDGTNWSSGWRVSVDTDQDGAYNTGDVELASRPALPAYFGTSGTGIATGSGAYVMFNGSGYAIDKDATSGNITITLQRSDLTSAAQLEQTRRVRIAVTGRVRVCKPASSSDTACPSTAGND